MNVGVLIGGFRPTSKTAIKRAHKAGETIVVDNTEFATPNAGKSFTLDVDLPDGRHDFVGPDPYKKRNFYGSIYVKDGRVTKIT